MEPDVVTLGDGFEATTLDLVFADEEELSSGLFFPPPPFTDLSSLAGAGGFVGLSNPLAPVLLPVLVLSLPEVALAVLLPELALSPVLLDDDDDDDDALP